MADTGITPTVSNSTTNGSCQSTTPSNSSSSHDSGIGPDSEIVEENGHSSPSEDLIKNGLGSEVSSLASSPSTPPQSVLPSQPTTVSSPGRVSRTRGSQRSSPNSGYGGGRGDSPHNVGGVGPQNPGVGGQVPTSNSQHVVHVHVNPGETFSVRLGDQIQHIQGKALSHVSLSCI